MATLAKVGEFAFIDAISRLTRRGTPGRGVRIGIGDDAAAVSGFRTTLLTTDTMVEDVHFRRDWLTPRALGRRAFRVAVSDIAAMGGVARYVLLSLILPPAYDAADASALAAGVIADAKRVGTFLVGGNVSSGDRVCVQLTVVGEGTGPLLRRDRARRGHSVYLTGPVGAASAGVELLAGGVATGALVRAYRQPPVRLGLARALARSNSVSAMIDVSDGVAQDLGHLCRASGVSAVLDPDAVPTKPALRIQAFAPRPATRRAGRARRIPAPMLRRAARDYALAGGEDYELLLTAPAAAETRLARICDRQGADLYRIGDIVRVDGKPEVRDRDGRRVRCPGFDHFRVAS